MNGELVISTRKLLREDKSRLAYRILELEDAMKKEWFENILSDLDYQEHFDGGSYVVWAWTEHPWYKLLNLTENECIEYLERNN